MIRAEKIHNYPAAMQVFARADEKTTIFIASVHAPAFGPIQLGGRRATLPSQR
jgi:hypothetical protein